MLVVLQFRTIYYCARCIIAGDNATDERVCRQGNSRASALLRHDQGSGLISHGVGARGVGAGMMTKTSTRAARHRGQSTMS